MLAFRPVQVFIDDAVAVTESEINVLSRCLRVICREIDFRATFSHVSEHSPPANTQAQLELIVEG